MQKLDVNKNGINGWYCKRNIYNDILTIQCSCCGETRDSNLEKTAVLVQIRRSGIFSGVNMADADERELHADFFLRWCQETETEVTPLSDADLTAWIRQMEHIVLKGKTKLLKAKEIERGRKAKSKPWLVQSNDDIDINESIKSVQERKARLSRIDKAKNVLQGMLGVSGAEDLIKKISGATDSQIKQLNLKDTSSAAKQISEAKPDEPFDWSKLTS